MKQMTNAEMKKEMIEILKYIDNICKENGIDYTLIGGSLIGAVRHKGFIPWDDDIDIGLLKKDYDKLINILKKPNDKYFLICHDTDKNCYFPHAKLVSLRTFHPIDNMGVFVDIFVYMYMPNEQTAIKKFYNKIVKYNNRISRLRKPGKKENLYIIRWVRYLIYKYIIGDKILFKSVKKLYGKYLSGDYVMGNLPLYGFNHEIINSSNFDNFERVPFENIEASITKTYDEMLSTVFGDYMTLPPVEKRKTHDLKAYWK